MIFKRLCSILLLSIFICTSFEVHCSDESLISKISSTITPLEIDKHLDESGVVDYVDEYGTTDGPLLKETVVDNEDIKEMFNDLVNNLDSQSAAQKLQAMIQEEFKKWKKKGDLDGGVWSCNLLFYLICEVIAYFFHEKYKIWFEIPQEVKDLVVNEEVCIEM